MPLLKIKISKEKSTVFEGIIRPEIEWNATYTLGKIKARDAGMEK